MFVGCRPHARRMSVYLPPGVAYRYGRKPRWKGLPASIGGAEPRDVPSAAFRSLAPAQFGEVVTDPCTHAP